MTVERSPLEVTSEQFLELAREVVTECAAYLEALPERAVFPETSGVLTTQHFGGAFPEQGMGRQSLAALREIAAHSRALNGRAAAYVLGSGEPVAALGDLFASILNQNITAWRSSPAAVTIERTVVRWLAEAIGCHGFTGTLTGGGSMANLSALACARERAAPVNRRGGAHGVVYASEEVHMSIPRAVSLLGIGRDNLRLIPTDDDLRLRVDALEEALEADLRDGRTPVAIVASAGTVTTGAIDPLNAIADLAAARGIWLHVDGAYGALAALGVPEKFGGLSRADSVSLDPHKWLYQPLDVGCVLYRDGAAARTAFSDPGEYVKGHSSDPIEGFAFFEESPELSRRFRALKLWLSLRFHGLSAFRNAIRADLAHAQQLANSLRQSPGWEVAAPVSLSAVCFRHLGPPAWEALPDRDARRDQLNQWILRELNASGAAFLSNGRVRGAFVLRACFTNFRTTVEDLDRIVRELVTLSNRATAEV